MRVSVINYCFFLALIAMIRDYDNRSFLQNTHLLLFDEYYNKYHLILIIVFCVYWNILYNTSIVFKEFYLTFYLTF